MSSVPRKTQKYSYLPSIGFQNSYMELLRVPWGTFHQRKKFKKISVNVEILVICEKHGIFRSTKLVLKSVKNGNVFRGKKSYWRAQDRLVQVGKKILSSLDQYLGRYEPLLSCELFRFDRKSLQFCPKKKDRNESK